MSTALLIVDIQNDYFPGGRMPLAHDACATRDVEFEGKSVAAADVQAAYMSALGFAYAKVMGTAEALKALG